MRRRSSGRWGPRRTRSSSSSASTSYRSSTICIGASPRFLTCLGVCADKVPQDDPGAHCRGTVNNALAAWYSSSVRHTCYATGPWNGQRRLAERRSWLRWQGVLDRDARPCCTICLGCVVMNKRCVCNSCVEPVNLVGFETCLCIMSRTQLAVARQRLAEHSE